MKKRGMVAFLWVILFIPAFVYAGSVPCYSVQSSVVSSSIQINNKAEKIQHHLVVLLAIHDFCTSTANHTNHTIQRLITSPEFYSCRFVDVIPGISSPGNLGNFLYQKDYLFYIYPSHHFW